MSLDAKKDAEAIHNALKVLFNDNKAIINLIGRRPNWHLQKVREQYEKLFETDLVNYLESQSSYNFKKLLIELAKSRAESKAVAIYKSVKGAGSDEQALIDVIIHSTPKQLEETKQFFRQKYEKSMDEWIKGDTVGNFEDILVACIKGNRSQEVQKNLIDSDVEALYKAGEAKWGTDDNTFIKILSERSFEHLQEVCKRYKEKHGKELSAAIKSETSGWYETALLACLTTPQDYWANRCHQAIKGLGTDDALLIRCFSFCSKPFLQELKKSYEKLFKVTLNEDIKGDTSGTYRELLETLLDLPESEAKLY